jgi:hypothetical protein
MPDAPQALKPESIWSSVMSRRGHDAVQGGFRLKDPRREGMGVSHISSTCDVHFFLQRQHTPAVVGISPSHSDDVPSAAFQG